MGINEILKIYRKDVLQITLKEMAEKTGTNLKTLSAFENGRSKNLEHIQKYYNCANDELSRTTLIHNLKWGLENGRQNKRD